MHETCKSFHDVVLSEAPRLDKCDKTETICTIVDLGVIWIPRLVALDKPVEETQLTEWAKDVIKYKFLRLNEIEMMIRSICQQEIYGRIDYPVLSQGTLKYIDERRKGLEVEYRRIDQEQNRLMRDQYELKAVPSDNKIDWDEITARHEKEKTDILIKLNRKRSEERKAKDLKFKEDKLNIQKMVLFVSFMQVFLPDILPEYKI